MGGVTKLVSNVTGAVGDVAKVVTGGGSAPPAPAPARAPAPAPSLPAATRPLPENAPLNIQDNPYYSDYLESQFALGSGPVDKAIGTVTMPDGTTYQTGSMAEAGAFRNFLSNRLSGPGQDQFTQLQDQFNTVQDQYGNLQQDFSGLQNQYGVIQDQYGNLRDQYGNLTDQYGNLQQDFSGLQNQYGVIQDQYGNLTDQFGNLQQDYSGLQSQFGDLQSQFQTTDQMRQQLANQQVLNLAQEQGLGPMAGPTVSQSPYQLPGAAPLSYAQAVPSQPMGTPTAGSASDFLYKSLLQQTPVSTPTYPLFGGIGSLPG
jgi:archaellum component FlaC